MLRSSVSLPVGMFGILFESICRKRAGLSPQRRSLADRRNVGSKFSTTASDRACLHRKGCTTHVKNSPKILTGRDLRDERVSTRWCVRANDTKTKRSLRRSDEYLLLLSSCGMRDGFEFHIVVCALALARYMLSRVSQRECGSAWVDQVPTLRTISRCREAVHDGVLEAAGAPQAWSWHVTARKKERLG